MISLLRIIGFTAIALALLIGVTSFFRPPPAVPTIADFTQQQPEREVVAGLYEPDPLSRLWLKRNGLGNTVPTLLLFPDGRFHLDTFPEGIFSGWSVDLKDSPLLTLEGRWHLEKRNGQWGPTLAFRGSCGVISNHYRLRRSASPFVLSVPFQDVNLGFLFGLEQARSNPSSQRTRFARR